MMSDGAYNMFALVNNKFKAFSNDTSTQFSGRIHDRAQLKPVAEAKKAGRAILEANALHMPLRRLRKLPEFSCFHKKSHFRFWGKICEQRNHTAVGGPNLQGKGWYEESIVV